MASYTRSDAQRYLLRAAEIQQALDTLDEPISERDLYRVAGNMGIQPAHLRAAIRDRQRPAVRRALLAARAMTVLVWASGLAGILAFLAGLGISGAANDVDAANGVMSVVGVAAPLWMISLMMRSVFLSMAWEK